jgi:hypothetical protein
MKPIDPLSGDSLTRVKLEAQVRALRRQVSQRERALALLNRRLLRLEHGEDGFPGVREIGAADIAGQVVLLRSQLSSLHDENDALKDELRWLRHSKIFRWSRPFRGTFYAVRRMFRRR